MVTRGEDRSVSLSLLMRPQSYQNRTSPYDLTEPQLPPRHSVSKQSHTGHEGFIIRTGGGDTVQPTALTEPSWHLAGALGAAPCHPCGGYECHLLHVCYALGTLLSATGSASSDKGKGPQSIRGHLASIQASLRSVLISCFILWSPEVRDCF